MQNKMIKHKKGGVPISIALLVLATLGVCFFALFTFSTQQDKLVGELSFSNDVYSEEYLLNYYIQNIVLDISPGISNSEEFILRFKFLLNNYRSDNGDYYVSGFEQIEDQLILENVLIDDSFVNLTLNFDLVSDRGDVKVYHFEKTYFGKI